MPHGLEQAKRVNQPGQTKQVQATFHRIDPDEEPTFVVIDGKVYRLESEEEQERATLLFKEEELRSKLLEKLDEESYKLLWELEEASDAEWNNHAEWMRRKLVEHLPAHAPIIDQVFIEGDAPAGMEEWRHRHCVLPAPQEGEASE